jgi:hypothetical protein
LEPASVADEVFDKLELNAAGTLNSATIFVRLHEIEDCDRDQFDVMSEVRSQVLPAVVPDNVRVAVQFTGGPGGGQGDIPFMVQGPGT